MPGGPNTYGAGGAPPMPPDAGAGASTLSPLEQDMADARARLAPDPAPAPTPNTMAGMTPEQFELMKARYGPVAVGQSERPVSQADAALAAARRRGGVAPPLPEHMRLKHGGLYDPLGTDAPNVIALGPEVGAYSQATADRGQAGRKQYWNSPYGIDQRMHERGQQHEQDKYDTQLGAHEAQRPFDEYAKTQQEGAWERMQEREQAAEELRQRQAEYIKDERNKIRKAEDKYQAMKVDPERIWSGTKGGFARIIAAIGVGFSTYASTMTGGENTALRIIEKAVDDDIDAQKHNIAKAGADVGRMKGLMEETAGEFDDKVAHELWSRKQIYQNTAELLRRNSVEANTAKEKFFLELAAKNHEFKAKQTGDAFELRRAVMHQQNKANAAAGIAARRKAELEAQQRRAVAMTPRGKEYNQIFVGGGTGRGWFAGRPEDASKLKEKYGVAFSVLDQHDKLIAIAKKPRTSITREDKAIAETIMSPVVGMPADISQMKGSVLTQGEIELLDDAYQGLPSDITNLTDDQLNHLKASRAMIANQLENIRVVEGLTAVTKHTGPTGVYYTIDAPAAGYAPPMPEAPAKRGRR